MKLIGFLIFLLLFIDTSFSQEKTKVEKSITKDSKRYYSEKEFKKANVIIDFTIPKCTFEVLKIAAKLNKRVVIGTTGFSKKDEELIKKYSMLAETYLLLVEVGQMF